MLAESFKRTKIIATLGPACRDLGIVRDMVDAGANAFRLNFSHGTHDEHASAIEQVRKVSKVVGKPLAVIQDLQGPRLRLGDLPHPIELTPGEQISFVFSSQAEGIPVQHDFSGYVSAGQNVLIKDGQIKIKITLAQKGRVEGIVERGGSISSHQGINLPEADLGGEILTDKDIEDIKFACTHDVDYIALSFIQNAQEVLDLKKRLREMESDAAVIAKIETRAAVENLESILRASDGVMVARGDLAVEIGTEKVPVLQRQIVRLACLHKKVVIVATQMLESMIDSTQPSRAEVSDIAGAVLQGADALMLSGETAAGHYPIEVVAMMKRVITTTEASVIKTHLARFGDQPVKENAISAAGITLAYQLGAKVIIAETSSGQTARNLASFRPPMPIIMVTHRQRVYQQLAIVWGGKSYLVKNPANATREVIGLLKKAGNVLPGDAIVVAAGNQPGVTGGTNRLEVQVVEN